MLTLMGLQTKEEMIFHTTKFGLISKGQANKRQRTRGMQKVIQLLESGKNVQAKQLADSLGIDFTQAKNRAKKLAEEAYKGLSISYLKKDEVEEAYTRFR
jgi:Holliday junction resolvasome RuvABC endonuclease subunit